ncbi:MAG: leucine-rich repeat protein [Candidatus Heimdallarchaeota archaeon]|nr:leucine-rich repeat protein [Candidatus Heimdallarchaeota archaeon]
MKDKVRIKSILAQLGLNSFFNPFPEYIVKFEQDTLIQLNLRNLDIPTIPHLEFDYLETLYIEQSNIHYITNVSLNLPRLKRLIIRGNKLRRLPADLFQDMPQLEVIDLSENLLIECPEFSHLKGLKSMNLMGNKLSSINTIENYNLEYFNCTRNNLKSLPDDMFVRASHLYEINCSSNSLVTFPDLKNNSNLVKIDISHNKIENLPIVATCKQLKYLLANDNNIAEITVSHFGHLSNLVRINLSHNIIRKIGKVFTQLEKLEWLELEYNLITEIDEYAFSDLSSLIKLNLKKNLLDHLPSGLFNGMHKLTMIILSDNNLNLLPYDIIQLPSLWEAYFNGNPIELPKYTFVGPEKIRYLKQLISDFYK